MLVTLFGISMLDRELQPENAPCSMLVTLAGMTMRDRDALIRILREPKNSLVKQYTKLFELDGVGLEFSDDAVEAIADKALERKTGARGLRAIMENVMLDLMYEIPSDDSISKCVIDREIVEKNLLLDGEEPLEIEDKKTA